MAQEKEKMLEPKKEGTYKVIGLTPLKDGSIPVVVNGKEIDLATASQETLKKLHDAKKRFIIVE